MPELTNNQLVFGWDGAKSTRGWPARVLAFDGDRQTVTLERFNDDGKSLGSITVSTDPDGRQSPWRFVSLSSLTKVQGLKQGAYALMKRQDGGYQVVELLHDVEPGAVLASTRFYDSSNDTAVGVSTRTYVESLTLVADVERRLL